MHSKQQPIAPENEQVPDEASTSLLPESCRSAAAKVQGIDQDQPIRTAPFEKAESKFYEGYAAINGLRLVHKDPLKFQNSWFYSTVLSKPQALP